MIRTANLEQALEFYCGKLCFTQIKRIEAEKFRLTYIVLAAEGDLPKEESKPTIELIHNWDERELPSGRNFGHLAFEVDDIYKTCAKLAELGVSLLRAPHDGHKAFINAPDSIVIELLQKGAPLPQREPSPCFRKDVASV